MLAQLLPVLPLVFPLIIAYCLWALLDRAPYEGGRCWHAAKHWRFPFAYFTAYFPVTVVREEELDPRDSYLFGYHPHGILGLGRPRIIVQFDAMNF